MRIVGGELSGRRIRVPKGEVRPTSDRVREAVASALASRDAFAGASVLDLFAGSGAFSFEALSRGAVRAHLVERNRASSRAIRRNAEELGVADRISVTQLDLSERGAPRTLERPEGGYSLVFADPPYDHVGWFAPLIDAIAAEGYLAQGAFVVLEHRTGTQWTPKPPLALESNYRYGDTSVTLAAYRPAEGNT